jgi:hypothetical protein
MISKLYHILHLIDLQYHQDQDLQGHQTVLTIKLKEQELIIN